MCLPVKQCLPVKMCLPPARFVKAPSLMPVLLRFAGVIVGAAMLVSCTRGVSEQPLNPVAPTPAAATVTKLTITPAGGGTMMIGGSAAIVTSGSLPTNTVVLGAFAEYSNGTGRYVEATWTSSNPAVVAVANGGLNAVGRGTATVTATFEGRSAEVPFEVIGGIAGTWTGTYLVEQCGASSGSLSEVLCTPPNTARQPGLAHVGATLPITMELTVSGSEVTGVVSFGTIRGTLMGQDRGTGFFFLTGVIEATGATLNIAHWDTRVQRDELAGFINYQLRLPNFPGTGGVGTRVSLTRLAPPALTSEGGR